MKIINRLMAENELQKKAKISWINSYGMTTSIFTYITQKEFDDYKKNNINCEFV